MHEHEKTFLAKYLPKNLSDSPSKDIIDIYIPEQSDHPKMRIRKSGDQMEITKKELVNPNDFSHFIEQTIKLTEKEFDVLSKIEGKRIIKKRYYYTTSVGIAEIDVFQEGLAGLVVVEFEFKDEKTKKSFIMSDFCLAEVTDETFIAGGMLCGKCYSDIIKELKRYNYKKIQ